MDGFAASGETWITRLLGDSSLQVRRIDLPAGGVLHEADAPAEQFFFIHEGEVRLYHVGPDGSGRLLDILGPGDWVGAAALGHLPAYGKRAVAVSAVVASAVPAANMLRVLGEHGDAAVQIIRQLAGKLQDAYGAASLLVFDDCEARLVKQLLRFSRSAAATPLGDGVVVLRITHEQLAQAVGAARETVSLCLTELRRQNLVRTGRNQLIFNPDALRRAAGHAAAEAVAAVGDVTPESAVSVTTAPVGPALAAAVAR